MHILLLDLGLEMRGGQRQVFYLARAIHTLFDGVEVTVACPKNSPLAEELRKHELPFITLPGHSAANPAVLFVMERAIGRIKPDIIHTNDAKSATLGHWLKKCHKQLKLVHSRRVSYPIKSNWRGKKYLQADAVIGVSQEITQSMICAGLDPDKAYTIHSGLDTSRYLPKEANAHEHFIFGAIGALTSQKGFSVLINAMSVLHEMEEMPAWAVYIIGEGPLFNPLLHQAESLHIEEHLAMFGYQDSTMMLPKFDALVVPSLDGEGSNGVIKEGWITGIPVIASNLPSNEELITNKVNGLLVPKNNPLALATAMLQIAKNKDLCCRLSTAGRQTLEDFTDLKMAEKTLEIYKKLVQS